MSEPRFLTLDEVLVIQHTLIERYGGLHGLRDAGLLESALAQPQAGFGGAYLHADLFEMAAAYLFHLTANHAFLDGNKRIGLAAAITFMRLNDIDVIADNAAAVNLVLAVARGEVEKPEIAAFLRSNSKS